MSKEAHSHAEKGAPFEALKDRGQNDFAGLETFDLSESVTAVAMQSDEFTAVCPVTGQPDMYRVNIQFSAKKGIESKSLKLYLGTYRNRGAFCEALADLILHDVVAALDPTMAQVILAQKSRGGISIFATAHYDETTGYGWPGIVPSLGLEQFSRPQPEI